MMRIVFITDIHGARHLAKRLADVCGDCDVLLVGGDVTTFGNAATAAAVLAPLRRAFSTP